MGRARWIAIALIAGWYAFALALLYPLADGPVVDSWLYGAAVRRFMASGEIRFAGFTFLSFSFMTEIPFLLLLMTAYLSFAKAEGPHREAWLWLAALLIVIDFLILPFAAMAIVGCAGAMLIFRYTGYARDVETHDTS